ncbi:MOSC domain-containing protein [Chloroflexota bacterium]
MVKKIKDLGKIRLVQLQPNGLIIETPSGSFYDESRRLVVDRLQISLKGIESTTTKGEQVLDIHHLDHPDKAYGDDDLVCIGFTSHYDAMREQFGEHMVDGIAGENIIIENDQEVWLEDLGRQIAIENGATGEMTLLDVLSYAKPCEEFSHFVTKSQHKDLPAAKLKSTLQFLNNGRRGFLLVLNEKQEKATIQAGDRVFAIHEEE